MKCHLLLNRFVDLYTDSYITYNKNRTKVIKGIIIIIGIIKVYYLEIFSLYLKRIG
jgi:hypothetical protein